jgi:hypothetical protein
MIKQFQFFKIYKAVFILCLIFAACVQDNEYLDDAIDLETKKILFIGNSYTFYHNMPAMTKRMALSVGDTMFYEQYTIPGAYLWQHANSVFLDQLIKKENWNYVTIQSQSRESALDQEHFNTKVYPNALTLVNQIRDNNSNSKPLFYMTWGYENGYTPLCNDLPYMCNFESMNDKIEERYTYFGSSTNSSVSPCGKVWKALRNEYPNINLYDDDGNHPSRLGSYVAACCFYTMIFEKDPTLLSYNDEYLDDNDEQIIKAMVKEIVYDRLDQWQFH